MSFYRDSLAVSAQPFDLERTKILLISEYPPPAGGMTVQAQQLFDSLRQAGCDIHALRTNPRFRGVFKFIDGIRLLRGLLKWLVFVAGCRRVFGADIVHVFSASGLNFYLFTLVPLLLAKISATPVIVNFHGGAAREFFSTRRGLLDWSMRASAGLVVPSGFLRAVFDEFGHATQMIGNIANFDRFAFSHREIEPPVLISVRNLTSVYNVSCALRAFALLQARHPEAVFYVAGDGPERARLEALRDELGLRNVEFLGNLDNAGLEEYYRRANLFINTSTVDNMPVSVLEAFVCGLPVVSTEVGGIPFLVKHEETGLLAPSDDHAALADRLLRLVDDRPLARRLVDNAYREVQAFTRENVTRQWLDCYARLVG